MTSEERQARTEWMKKLGVPVAFHDAIVEAPNDWVTVGGGVVPGVLMIAITVGVMAAAFIGLDAYVQARAMALAAKTGASLVHVNVGLGPFVLLFGMIALTGWVSMAFAAHYRVKGFLSAAATALKPPPTHGLTGLLVLWLGQRMLAGPVRRAAGASANVDDFLRRMVRGVARPWGIVAAVLLPLAIILSALETNSFWVAGPGGIIEHTMFAPFSSQRHDLAEVMTVTTGCNHTDDGEWLHYNVSLSSGEEFAINAATTKVVAGSKPAAIEAIAGRLDSGVEHRRWSHLDRDSVHPNCLSYWARQFGRDGVERLAGLLRLTPDEARRWPLASSIRPR